MRLVIALALALSAGPGQPGPQAATASTTLDVIVNDARGRAVETLGPADFSVTDQNGPLTVDAVRFVRARDDATDVVNLPISSADDEIAAVDETRRLIAIFLDEFHVTPGPGADRARQALIRFVSEDLKSDDLVVIFKPLDSLLDIRLTRDRTAAVRAIESFDPRRGDYRPRTAFERNFIAGAPARVETARAQIAASSLEAIATHLGRFSPSRKTLIVVSEGFSRTMRRRGDELLPSADSVVLAANRAHVSIYPIEPVGDDPTDVTSDGPTRDAAAESRLRNALRSLADGTAGQATAAADDWGSALKRALTDASGYYVLTVSSADPRRAGHFHPVDVTVRRTGLVTRARRGYWAPSNEDATWRSSVTPSRAESFASRLARRTSPLIRPWFGMSHGADGATRISFVWEPAPRVPGDRQSPPAPERVVLSVTTLDGSPVFDGVVFPANPAGPDPVERPARASFESPAGRLLVQMAIEDATSRVVDRDVRDLVVEGFGGPVTIGSSEVLRARNAREYQLLAKDPDAPPVATRQFSRTERLLIRVPVFSSGDVPAVSARLVSGLGSSMRELTVSPVPSRSALYQIDLPLAGLANGLYSIELTARTSRGESRDSLPFRVTP